MYAQSRKQMIQKIHIAKTQLQLDDSTYRTLLTEVTGKNSCSKMADKELMAVLQALKAKGFKVESKRGGKRVEASHYNPTRQGYLAKIEALLLNQQKSWAYVHGICKRAFGKERLQWCSDEEMYKVLQMLAVNAYRYGK